MAVSGRAIRAECTALPGDRAGPISEAIRYHDAYRGTSSPAQLGRMPAGRRGRAVGMTCRRGPPSACRHLPPLRGRRELRLAVSWRGAPATCECCRYRTLSPTTPTEETPLPRSGGGCRQVGGGSGWRCRGRKAPATSECCRYRTFRPRHPPKKPLSRAAGESEAGYHQPNGRQEGALSGRFRNGPLPPAGPFPRCAGEGAPVGGVVDVRRRQPANVVGTALFARVAVFHAVRAMRIAIASPARQP
ncbi:hypothetical protein HNQ52_003209 [Chiayiivirga flava]|uniref:Uncharacterized protein n=1 Tax=Chiayiivirga flava TaxID=659595 RepID=A0A7W8D8N0_9GAMM|nr:hypothetical protein [Chiayiivirga flava]